MHIYNVKINKSCEPNSIEKIDQILLGPRRRHEECNEGRREREKKSIFLFFLFN